MSRGEFTRLKERIARVEAGMAIDCRRREIEEFRVAYDRLTPMEREELLEIHCEMEDPATHLGVALVNFGQEEVSMELSEPCRERLSEIIRLMNNPECGGGGREQRDPGKGADGCQKLAAAQSNLAAAAVSSSIQTEQRQSRVCACGHCGIDYRPNCFNWQRPDCATYMPRALPSHTLLSSSNAS
jgi:hypothetical protein